MTLTGRADNSNTRKYQGWLTLTR